MLRNPARRDIIRTEEKYRQAGGSYSTAIAQRYQTQNFKVHPSDRLPFPLEFRNHNAVLENHSGSLWLQGGEKV